MLRVVFQRHEWPQVGKTIHTVVCSFKKLASYQVIVEWATCSAHCRSQKMGCIVLYAFNVVANPAEDYHRRLMVIANYQYAVYIGAYNN